MSHERVRRLTGLAALAALSLVLLLAIPGIPLIPGFEFLRYDMADVPILLTGLSFGPLGALLVLVVVSAIQAFAVNSDGIIGFTMHVVASGILVLLPAFAYRRWPQLKHLIISLVLGVLGMTVLMCGMNLLLTPLYTGLPVSTVAGMLVPAVIPFNLLKGGINAGLALVVFLALKPFLQRWLQRSQG